MIRELQISYRRPELETTVCIGEGTAAQLWENVRKPFIITNQTLVEICPDEHFCRTALLPAGAETKSLATVERLLKWLSDKGCCRNDEIIAFGDSTISDVAGFAASIYKGGLKWHIIPTTLLAMADSAIGGKTAVNAGQIKNLAEIDHPPTTVAIDPVFLKALAPDDHLSGIGEILKMALLDGDLLYDTVLQYSKLILEAEPGIMTDVLHMSCGIKADIVSADIFSRGQLTILNAGDTLAQAIESDSGYTVPHGKAVATGILMEARIGEQLGVTEPDTVNKIESLLSLYGFEKSYTFQGDLSALIGGANTVLIPFIQEIGTVLIEQVDTEKLIETLDSLRD